jgi:predicted RNase H-like nuclease
MNHPTLTWLPAPNLSCVGVDGCKGGWIVATITDSKIEFALLRQLTSFLENTQARVLIDMPIGLPAQQRRSCDLEARTILGQRRSTLFPVATREALFAETYLDCCEVNARLQGCRVSKQLWNLTPKIRHLDCILQTQPSVHSYVAEGHPELAFLSLAGKRSAFLPKKTPEGQHQRITVIDENLPGSVRDAVARFITKHSRDATIVDCLDAAALALLLFKGRGGIHFLGDGAADEAGIPMRIASS